MIDFPTRLSFAGRAHARLERQDALSLEQSRPGTILGVKEPLVGHALACEMMRKRNSERRQKHTHDVAMSTVIRIHL